MFYADTLPENKVKVVMLLNCTLLPYEYIIPCSYMSAMFVTVLMVTLFEETSFQQMNLRRFTSRVTFVGVLICYSVNIVITSKDYGTNSRVPFLIVHTYSTIDHITATIHFGLTCTKVVTINFSNHPLFGYRLRVCVFPTTYVAVILYEV